MKAIKNLLEKVHVTSISGDVEMEINQVGFDSREMNPGSLFVAIQGTQADGHQFIEQAIKNGSIAIICEKIPSRLREKITYIAVKSSSMALGIIASNYYGNPSGKLTVIAITGTNGKTTIVNILFQLFRKLGYNVGMISTVENRINDHVIPTSHTTPNPVNLNKLLNQMIEEGCTHCFMEASSHAIVQERISGLKFTGAIFSNISHDHLDYHKSFENYIKAKKKLFDGLPSSAFALVNLDDKRGKIMQQNTKALKSSFSLKSDTEYKAKILTSTLEGLELEIDKKQVWFKMIGEFNAYNLLASYGAAMLVGEDSDEVLKYLSEVDPAPGRFERVENDVKITAIVDYAHTPDALKNVLNTINKFRTGNELVITVLGCGGNRDTEKRPVMASIASELSDKVILTSDNPRSENPDNIIREMKAGITASKQKKTIVLSDREEAIKTACLMAREKDIILVAGKGHEKYQEIKGTRFPFDDKEVLERMLKLFSN